MTPFQVVYGRKPLEILRFEKGATSVSMVEEQLLAWDLMLEELKAHLQRAQLLMKKATDKKRRDVKFHVGDLVYLKLRPYRRKTLAGCPNEKLAPKFYGPFRIEKEVGPVAYRLALPSNCHIHPVFHVSQLREAHGQPRVLLAIPDQLSPDLELLVEPEAVLGIRPGRSATLGSNVGTL